MHSYTRHPSTYDIYTDSGGGPSMCMCYLCRGRSKINSSSPLLVNCGSSLLVFRSHTHNAAAADERLCVCHGWCTQSSHCRSADDTDAQSSSATPVAAVD